MSQRSTDSDPTGGPRGPWAPAPKRRDRRVAKNVRLALVCGAIFCGMVGSAFAFVPLYRAFCQATGFAGTVRRAYKPPSAISNRTVEVAFNTNVRGLDWTFAPNVPSQVARLGDSKLAFFKVTNNSDAPLTGRAVYNVSPDSAGAYFSKLECFCFTNQTLAPHQTAEFPVVYYVDPRFGSSDDSSGVKVITLSYTFFPAPRSKGSG
jgi:cytochrome c oxidase assembly protein subunit 11